MTKNKKFGDSLNNKKNMRRVSVLISAQTLWNLGRLAKMTRYGDNIGKVIDKLVREKMVETKGWNR